jgi:hypothetical protein
MIHWPLTAVLDEQACYDWLQQMLSCAKTQRVALQERCDCCRWREGMAHAVAPP